MLKPEVDLRVVGHPAQSASTSISKSRQLTGVRVECSGWLYYKLEVLGSFEGSVVSV